MCMMLMWHIGRRSHKAARESPLDILKKRYARGEITREQYEEMRRVLMDGEGGSGHGHQGGHG